MKVWILIAVLVVINAGLWGYNIGHLDAPQPAVDYHLDNMHEVSCNDIVSMPPDGKPVCEVNMNAEDDNIRIFKGNGSINDEG